jgi:hypothetical protein
MRQILTDETEVLSHIPEVLTRQAQHDEGTPFACPASSATPRQPLCCMGRPWTVAVLLSAMLAAVRFSVSVWPCPAAPPPGAGKSRLALRLTTILPAMTLAEH